MSALTPAGVILMIVRTKNVSEIWRGRKFISGPRRSRASMRFAALANPYTSQMGRAILRPSDAATLQPRAKPRSGGIRAKISDTVPMGVISCECPLWVVSGHSQTSAYGQKRTFKFVENRGLSPNIIMDSHYILIFIFKENI